MGRSEGDERFDKLLRGLGYAVLGIQKEGDEERNPSILLTEVRFKLGADNRTSVLVVIKGRAGDGAVVAFLGTPSLETAVLALGKSLKAGSLRWREDRPYGG